MEGEAAGAGTDAPGDAAVVTELFAGGEDAPAEMKREILVSIQL